MDSGGAVVLCIANLYDDRIPSSTQVFEYISDSLEVVLGNMVANISIWREQASPGFAGYSLQWTYPCIGVFSREFMLQVLETQLPDAFRHAFDWPIWFKE
jgi:hypothetical protein